MGRDWTLKHQKIKIRNNLLKDIKIKSLDIRRKEGFKFLLVQYIKYYRGFLIVYSINF